MGIVGSDSLQTLWMRAMVGATSPEILAPPPLSARSTPAAPVPASTTAAAALAAPAFDIVRVEPSGETVVAGHAFATAKVELRDGVRPLGVIAANESGQFVILPERRGSANCGLPRTMRQARRACPTSSG